MILRKAEIRFSLPVQCVVCGFRGQSEVKCLELKGHFSLETLATRLRGSRVGRDFPVGWGNYHDGLRCPDCVAAHREVSK